jgi:hypothetical protein
MKTLLLVSLFALASCAAVKWQKLSTTDTNRVSLNDSGMQVRTVIKTVKSVYKDTVVLVSTDTTTMIKVDTVRDAAKLPVKAKRAVK